MQFSFIFYSKTEPICLQIYKRHNYIIEMKIQKQSLYEDGDCTKSIYPELYETSEMGSPYITLISSTPPSLRCPNLGKYMASGVTQDGRVMRDVCGNGNQGTSFNTLVVGCDDKGTMEFHSKCTSEEPITCKWPKILLKFINAQGIFLNTFVFVFYSLHMSW